MPAHLARLATAVVILALTAGCLSGWLKYEETRADFDRASAKYRAVKSAYYAVSETLQVLGEPLGVGDPCDEDDEEAGDHEPVALAAAP